MMHAASQGSNAFRAIPCAEKTQGLRQTKNVVGRNIALGNVAQALSVRLRSFIDMAPLAWAALLVSIKLSHLNLDGAFPSAHGTIHDSSCNGPEIDLIEVEDVPTARADVNALPISVFHRIVGNRIHWLSQNLRCALSNSITVSTRQPPIGRGAAAHRFGRFIWTMRRIRIEQR